VDNFKNCARKNQTTKAKSQSLEVALALQNKDTARLYRLKDKSASKGKERKTKQIRTRRKPTFTCG